MFSLIFYWDLMVQSFRGLFGWYYVQSYYSLERSVEHQVNFFFFFKDLSQLRKFSFNIWCLGTLSRYKELDDNVQTTLDTKLSFLPLVHSFICRSGINVLQCPFISPPTSLCKGRTPPDGRVNFSTMSLFFTRS